MPKLIATHTNYQKYCTTKKFSFISILLKNVGGTSLCSWMHGVCLECIVHLVDIQYISCISFILPSFASKGEQTVDKTLATVSRNVSVYNEHLKSFNLLNQSTWSWVKHAVTWLAYLIETVQMFVINIDVLICVKTGNVLSAVCFILRCKHPYQLCITTQYFGLMYSENNWQVWKIKTT